ncbi:MULTISPECIES: RraA family protein [unclassified Knoellia]|uniref:RraA family protein n=1 Tax=Knoellia altitudinis TaxID=3404795 RepID=UPI003621CF9F
MGHTAEAATDSSTDDPLLDRFRVLPAANIGDAMDRMGLLHSSIQSIWPGGTLVGTAFTVWTRAGDNKVIHEALALARPGDVLVINGQGDESRALIGELIGARAKVNGIVGFVLDGVARDADMLMGMEMPVFARGVTPAGPFKHGPGFLGQTIAVGGVAVAAGDYIIGDADGVAVVPRAVADQVATAAEAVFARETERRAAILAELA